MKTRAPKHTPITGSRNIPLRWPLSFQSVFNKGPPKPKGSTLGGPRQSPLRGRDWGPGGGGGVTLRLVRRFRIDRV